ncbi:hypothetical protein V494_08431 [Pseudogymnoascus sp. VKM F-4513 (FW-928)]|nr:hypothetical protein V494_08431 [Pseudogymnoascus sp. VKM F-4513 (FW-928)]
MTTTPASNTPRFDPNFTQHVIDSMGPNTSPRMREVMASLTKHIHDFAREVELTEDEWMQGVQLINWAGQMSNEKRNEGQLLCDIIGLESLVDEITYKKASKATTSATRSAILGPFFRKDHPIREKGATISFNTPDDAEIVYMYGSVLDAATKKPLPNATIDVWEASTNGLYEQQDDHQVDSNLRGKFITDVNGEYAFYCLKPTDYPVPDDGPAGKLLNLLDRQPYRPAHIHLVAVIDGFKPLITQIFDKDSKFLDNDSVFAVQDSLLVEFVPRNGDEKAKLELDTVDALGDELAKNSQMYMGQHGHVLTFPIEKGKTMNVVAFRTKPDGKISSGWGNKVTSMISLMEKVDVWALFEHPPAPTYYKGRSCILGDAAHASTPHQGAGAGQAIEDAYILLHRLGLAASAADITQAFKVYDAVRRPRSQSIVTTSKDAGCLYVMEDEEVGSDMDKTRENLLARNDWIWGNDLKAQFREAKDATMK